jgi:hypothetical protein
MFYNLEFSKLSAEKAEEVSVLNSFLLLIANHRCICIINRCLKCKVTSQNDRAHIWQRFTIVDSILYVAVPLCTLYSAVLLLHTTLLAMIIV